MKQSLFKDFNFSLLNSPDFKEDSVREELIKPILDALGYSASGKYKIIRSKALQHPFVNIGSQKRKINLIPDYLFEIEKKYGWVLDAKAPEEDIRTGENVEQIYSYSIHPEINVNIFALCNGREFIVFKINEERPILSFHLSEIDKYCNKLESILSPTNFTKKRIEKTSLQIEKNKEEFDYLSCIPLSEIPSRKQAAKRHFGVHGYFTKQAWNVVSDYILNFTDRGDLVLDPFGGSGVTFIEAIMNGRKAIHIDLNPLSVFIVKGLVTPVKEKDLYNEYNVIIDKFVKDGPKTKHDIESALRKYPYPKNITLPKSSDVVSIEQLFSKYQLANLAYLKSLIIKVKDKNIRNALLLAFSSTISKINLTYHPSTTRGENAGDNAVFRYYRYRIAPEKVELDVINTFEIKFNKLRKAKKEIGTVVNASIFGDSKIYKGTATDLKEIKTESVDYIYTDPPYGSKIPYLDLSIMWNAWLDLTVNEKDYKLEAIEGGEHNITKEHYADLINKSINEMYRVLKFNRWMSFVFAHKDPAYWHMIVESAEKAGFEYVSAVKQLSGQSSFKKRQNPFTVLSGQLIINFKKVDNPKSRMKFQLGDNVMDLAMNNIESTIAEKDGATLEEISNQLQINAIELNFIDILAREIGDITPILNQQYDFDDETQKYHLKKNTKFKANIDLNLRIKYFLLSYMRRMEAQKFYPTFEDVIFNIMPLLKNGITPENQTILSVLESIADKVGHDRWRLKNTGQMDLF
jgi:DNA modification methylase